MSGKDSVDFFGTVLAMMNVIQADYAGKEKLEKNAQENGFDSIEPKNQNVGHHCLNTVVTGAGTA